MTKVLIAAMLLTASGLPALAQTSSKMNCAHYGAMNAAGQMAAVDSMRSSMSAADKMASSSGGMSSDHMSSNEVAKKVAVGCRDHPTMMVQDAIKNAMSH
jgi:hypothetical protein